MGLKIKNKGVLFTIDFPAEKLLKEIAGDRQEWEYAFCEAIGVLPTKRIPIGDVKLDVDNMIDKIKYYSADENEIKELLSIIPRKKNNKLSKSGKPKLYAMNSGYYMKEFHSWATQEIYIKVIDELTAKVYMERALISR